MKAAVCAQTLLAADVTGAAYGCQYFSRFLPLSCGTCFFGTTPEDLCRALKGKAGRAPFLSLVVAGLGMTMAVMFLLDPLLAKATIAFTPSNSIVLFCFPFASLFFLMCAVGVILLFACGWTLLEEVAGGLTTGLSGL